METNIDRECTVCHHIVEVGGDYYYTFTTGEYRHRACGLATGRLPAELVSLAPSMYEEIERLRVVNAALLEALREKVRRCPGMHPDPRYNPADCCAQARAAIAAATGGHDGV